MAPEEAVAAAVGHVVAVVAPGASGGVADRGSGFAVVGSMVTCRHVVEDAVEVRVVLSDGKSFRVPVEEVVFGDARELAVLQPPVPAARGTVFGGPSSVFPGGWVAVLGAPEGEVESAAGALKFTGTVQEERWLVVSAGAVPGHSGGPVVDREGRVVDVVAMAAGPPGSVCLAVPADAVGGLLAQGKPAAGSEARLQKRQPGGIILKGTGVFVLRVLLATGFEDLDREIAELLEREKDQGVVCAGECYYREALAAMCGQCQADVAVVSAELPGRADVLDVVRGLRRENVRVVLLPGARDDGRAVSLARRAASFGVYDLVWDEVDSAAVVRRVLKPATLAEVGLEPEGEVEIPAVGRPPEWWASLAGRLRLKVPSRKASVTVVGPGGEVSRKEGAEPDAVFSDPAPLAVFVPAAAGVECVRRLCRDPRSRAVPVVVVSGRRRKREFIDAGAARVVKKVTEGVVKEVSALGERMRFLWTAAETDYLTGCYARRFWDAWVQEQSAVGRPFSVAVLDIDCFKRVNDEYGHKAGDAVLAAFGAFLRSGVRAVDVVARYGGEEFAVGLLNVGSRGAAAMVDRLRERWAESPVSAAGRRVRCTFSAGVAEWRPGADVVAEADAALLEAKRGGRNVVRESSPGKGVLALCRVAELQALGVRTVSDPRDAVCAVADLRTFRSAPHGIPLVVIGSGTVADFAVKRARPDAVVCPSVEEAASAAHARARGVGEPAVRGGERGAAPPGEAPGASPEKTVKEVLEEPPEETPEGAAGRPAEKPPEGPRPGVTVIRGGATTERGQSLKRHSALYVVCPSQPSLAGEAAASLARGVRGAALVCAAGNCTGALAMGLPPERLVASDWRVPGSSAPVEVGGVQVWPVDPLKFLEVRESAHVLVNRVRDAFSLVVVDCGGALDVCAGARRTDGVLVLRVAGDAAERVVDHWVRSYGGPNVLVLPPGSRPGIAEAGDGFVVLPGGAAAPSSARK